MAKVIFTPWKDQTQLVAVRNQFYPAPSYDGPDMRSKACATVESWKLRGNLPHPIEATALLTDAILHDDSFKNSIFSIRATYSAAFCRFVTGLVDSKLHGQRKTMFQRAVDLGLPASFVELRHEATHRELPSLIVLRNAAQRSLEWLWDYYWAKTDVTTALGPLPDDVARGVDGVDGAEDRDPVQAAVRASLDPLLRDEESSEPPLKKRKVQQRLSAVATQLVAICKDSEQGAVVLSNALLEESVLVPAGKMVGDSLTDAFTKWDRFLQTITEEYPPFLTALTEEMINVLAFTDAAKAQDNGRCKGIYLWLDHILRSTEWASQRRLLSFAYISAVCQETTNQWTTLLKKQIPTGINEVPQLPKSQLLSGTNGSEANAAGTTDDLNSLRKFGWETADAWSSRPLGMV